MTQPKKTIPEELLEIESKVAKLQAQLVTLLDRGDSNSLYDRITHCSNMMTQLRLSIKTTAQGTGHGV